MAQGYPDTVWVASCVYCGSQSTPNWWESDSALEGVYEGLAAVCCWDHYMYGQIPFAPQPFAYRPTVVADPFNQAMRYPPRIPGAPGNAGATPIDG